MYTNVLVSILVNYSSIITIMAAVNKDFVLAVSLVLSVVSLVLLFGTTWYFHSSLDLLQQQVEYDRELLFKLYKQINVSDVQQVKY